MKRLISLVTLILLLSLPSSLALAHSGRTDSNGGHNCSEASKAKGLCSGYHYHNGGNSSSGSSSSGSGSSSGTGSKTTSNSPSPAPKATEEKLSNNDVKITFPAYAIRVNGQIIDNTSSKYPLFVYKGITYFPMTWNYSQALGLRTSWSFETGFAINKDESIPYQDKVSLDSGESVSSGSSAIAALPDYNVLLNDTRIDNSNEEYPILTYKDITYFPMTWKFAVEELGLTIKWDNTEGLFIQRPDKSK